MQKKISKFSESRRSHYHHICASV